MSAHISTEECAPISHRSAFRNNSIQFAYVNQYGNSGGGDSILPEQLFDPYKHRPNDRRLNGIRLCPSVFHTHFFTHTFQHIYISIFPQLRLRTVANKAAPSHPSKDERRTPETLFYTCFIFNYDSGYNRTTVVVVAMLILMNLWFFICSHPMHILISLYNWVDRGNWPGAGNYRLQWLKHRIK